VLSRSAILRRLRCGGDEQAGGQAAGKAAAPAPAELPTIEEEALFLALKILRKSLGRQTQGAGLRHLQRRTLLAMAAGRSAHARTFRDLRVGPRAKPSTGDAFSPCWRMSEPACWGVCAIQVNGCMGAEEALVGHPR